MKFPKINRQPLRTVTVPKLSGGTNLRDAITLVQDNQLTECKNMWFKDNILKTRPGITHVSYTNDIYLGGDTLKKNNVIMLVAGEKCSLVSFIESGDNYIGVTFRWVNGVGMNRGLPTYIKSFTATTVENYFAVRQGEDIYCFVKFNDANKIYKLNGVEWNELTEEQIYAPLLLTNCKTNGQTSMQPADIMNFGAAMLEGYNLLGNYYRMLYSTVNRELFTENNTNHSMTYSLYQNTAKEEFIGKRVTAKITNKSGTEYTHTVIISSTNNWSIEAEHPGDGLYMQVLAQMVWFCTNAGGSAAFVTEVDYVENNLEITAPCSNDRANLEKIFNMTENMWFGGDALGISGGTRLFLGGNTKEKEKSLVAWSGLNQPLYFSENCYAYVGDSSQRVTAFGRQGDTLVIFKEKEIFYTKYTQNANISAEDLINQSVVDYSASNVYFPMIQLHSTIGCDCPDSVQLCRNYLVWANSSGELYTLRAENQYSERNIYCISDMIERKIKANNLAGEIKNAHSADYEGHYFLFVGRDVYVMDYESYGYIYVSSHSKTEDAQVKIPWWYWRLPENNNNELIGMMSCGGLPVAFYKTLAGENYALLTSVFNKNADMDDFGSSSAEIASMITTKLFDFDAPHYTKNVPLINIALGNNGGRPINVSFVTDAGIEEYESIVLSESNEDEYSPDFVHNRQLRPCISLIKRIGIKAECRGKMSIDSISLRFKSLGGAR